MRDAIVVIEFPGKLLNGDRNENGETFAAFKRRGAGLAERFDVSSMYFE